MSASRGVFWPDHAPGAARANLRQLLTLMRGLDWTAGLEVEGARLRWGVDTDLSAFGRAVAGKDWAAALARYGGPLLDGLDGDGTGEFGTWLDLERRRVYEAWRMALLRRAGELTGQGAHLEAADLLSPLLEGDELDEEALGARVLALWRAGGHEQARQTHAAFDAVRRCRSPGARRGGQAAPEQYRRRHCRRGPGGSGPV